MALNFANSAAVPVPTSFSKQQLFEELAWFMPALERSFVRLYGPRYWSGTSSATDRSLQALQASPMWRSLSELYDYGVHGVLPTISELGDGSLFDVEMFVEGIDGLREYLREDDGEIPKLSKATIALARARLDLDQSGSNEEVAMWKMVLLARQSEEMVCSRLGTMPGAAISVGRAREALAQLFGFVPTGSWDLPNFTFVQCVPMELPIDVVRAINERAGLAGITPFEILRSAFAEEIGRDVHQSAMGAMQALLSAHA